MNRVLVIGCIGAGKSVFATRLEERLGLPLIHLDRLFWREGRGPAPREEWQQIQRQLVAGPSWIIEGNYGATIDTRLARADTVIFLDYPAACCVFGLIKRIVLVRCGVEKRPDIVAGCNERLDFRLLAQAASFGKRHRAGILRGVARYPQIELVRLRSRREAGAFLDRIGSAAD